MQTFLTEINFTSKKKWTCQIIFEGLVFFMHPALEATFVKTGKSLLKKKQNFLRLGGKGFPQRVQSRLKSGRWVAVDGFKESDLLFGAQLFAVVFRARGCSAGIAPGIAAHLAEMAVAAGVFSGIEGFAGFLRLKDLHARNHSEFAPLLCVFFFHGSSSP